MLNGHDAMAPFNAGIRPLRSFLLGIFGKATRFDGRSALRFGFEGEGGKVVDAGSARSIHHRHDGAVAGLTVG